MKEVTNKILILSIAVLLTACGGDETVENSSQVAAKVNNNEITVHQVNQILSKTPVNGAASTQDIANQILDKLIDQKVLEQKALALKLDRNPDVLSRLEAARQQILVEAYIERQVLTPTVEESAIRDYFNNNPKLFSERKIFNYSQVVVAANEADIPKLVEEVKKVSEITQFVKFVEDLNLQHKLDKGFSGTERLPKPLIEPLYALAVGDIGYLVMSDGFLVIELHNALSEPVEYAAAKPAINQFLRTEKRKESIQKLVSDFRKEATLEYVGEFSAPSTDG